jgi:hypothetical protein
VKCIKPGIIQAYIDGELDIAGKKDIEKHIGECEKCRESYNRLKNTDDFVFEKTSVYKQHYAKCAVPQTDNKFVAVTDKAGPGFFPKFRKVIGAACICLAVAVCVTIQPVRAFITNALSIFRIENIKGLNISLADLEEIRSRLAAKENEINIENMGRIVMDGFITSEVSMEEVKTFKDFPVILPESPGNGSISLSTVSPGYIEFTLDIANVNSVLKSFGSDKLLPESLDRKTFSAYFPRRLIMDYITGGKHYGVLQFASPEFTVPEGVDVDEIHDCMLELPIIPQDLQDQLKTIRDWKSTMYVPVVGPETEDININGSAGILSTTHDGEGYIAVWYREGIIYYVESNTGKDDIIRFANSLK